MQRNDDFRVCGLGQARFGGKNYRIINCVRDNCYALHVFYVMVLSLEGMNRALGSGFTLRSSAIASTVQSLRRFQTVMGLVHRVTLE